MSEAPNDAASSKKKMFKVAFFVFRLLLVVGAFVFVFSPETFGFREDLFQGVTPLSILEHVKGLDPGHAAFWLTFAALVKIGGIFSGVMRWHLLLKGQGIELPFWYLTKSWFMGRMVGLFLPGTVGLDGYRLVESSAYTREPIKCTTVIAVEKLIGIVSLGLLVFLTLPLVFRLFDVNAVILVIVLGILFSFISVSFLLLMNPRIVQVIVAAVPTPGFIRKQVNNLGSAITAYSGHRSTLLLATFFGLCVHLGICLMYFGNAMAMSGGSAKLLDVLFASPLVIVASVVTPTVSGAGVREVGFGMLLGNAYGQDPAILIGHLGLWVGEMVPFVLSVPLLILAGRPNRETFMARMTEIRQASGGTDLNVHLAPGELLNYRIKLGKCVLAGIFAGLIGGAAYGLAEAQWHMSILSTISDTSAYIWAPVVYGLVFTSMGVGAAAVMVFLYLLFNRFAPASVTFGLCLGGTLGLLILALGRFKYQRDVLGEHAFSSGQNMMLLGTTVGVAVGACVLGALIVHFGRGSVWRGVAGGLATYLLIVVGGVAMASITKPNLVPQAFMPTTAATGPNVILIAVDTLRADYLSVYNEEATPKTPNITALAEDAIRFENNFAQSSWTKASFGTIFSGMYPEAHTATGKASALPDELITFPERLLNGGYYTKGYSNNPNITSVWNYDQGFVDYVDLKPNLYFGAKASSEKLILYDILRKVVNKVFAKMGGRIAITDYYQPGNAVTDTAVDWIDSDERPDDAPFFLFLHYMDPHDPFRDPDRPGKGYARAQLPNPDPEKYTEVFKRSYAYEVEFMDEHVGRLLDSLRERGLYDDTLIVFTADHGEEFYEHGGFWHGLSLYDEQIAVPLLIKLPGNKYGGKRNAFMSRLVDLAPTITKIVGLEGADMWQGGALFTSDYLEGNAGNEFAYGHLDFEGIVLRSVRTIDTKLINSNEGNKRDYAPVEYYDLLVDPGEQVNLAEDMDHQEDIDRLTETIGAMQGFILENKAEPVTSEEGMKESEESLKSLGYLE